jgi:lysophospholipase L1-like esterase
MRVLIRIARWSLCVCSVLIVWFFVIELVAQAGLGVAPLQYSRAHEAYFGFGSEYERRSRAEMEESAAGPGRYNYRRTLGFYLYNPSRAVLATERSDFLLRPGKLKTYPVGQIDELSCGRQGSVRVFVLGAEVAAGFGASASDTTWYSILEQRLREEFESTDIYIFNAAMSDFMSTQELLAFELTLVPRAPDIVLVLNGYNDAVLPFSAALRPGDPVDMPLRDFRIYASPLLHFALDNSVIVANVWQFNIRKRLAQVRSSILADPQRKLHYLTSVTELYANNVSRLFQRCDDIGSECLLALQPSRVLVNDSGSTSDESGMSPNFARQLYKKMRSDVSQLVDANKFLDLSGQFSTSAQMSMFADDVSLDDRGQERMASLMYPQVRKAVEKRLQAGERSRSKQLAMRCERLDVAKEAMANNAKLMPLQNLSAIADGQILPEAAGIAITTAAAAWTYSAGGRVVIPQFDTTRKKIILRVRMHVRRGTVGVGMLDAKGSAWASQASLGESGKFAEVELAIPAGMRNGQLVFYNNRTDGKRTVVFVQSIQFSVY